MKIAASLWLKPARALGICRHSVAFVRYFQTASLPYPFGRVRPHW
jgi:hypothetical protein